MTITAQLKHSVKQGIVNFSRSDFVTPLKVRESQMEDCDDVLQLLKEHVSWTFFMSIECQSTFKCSFKPIFVIIAVSRSSL